MELKVMIGWLDMPVQPDMMTMKNFMALPEMIIFRAAMEKISSMAMKEMIRSLAETEMISLREAQVMTIFRAMPEMIHISSILVMEKILSRISKIPIHQAETTASYLAKA